MNRLCMQKTSLLEGHNRFTEISENQFLMCFDTLFVFAHRFLKHMYDFWI